MSIRLLPSILVAFAFAAFCGGTPAAKADQLEDAKTFVHSVVDKGIHALTGKSIPEAERPKLFLDFMHKYGDTPYAEQEMVGRYWERATPEQRAAYINLLEDYLVIANIDGLRDFEKDEHIDILDAEKVGDRIVVHSIDVDPSDPPPSRINWVLAVRPDGFRVADVTFEGVSSIDTFKADFTGIIRNAGGKFAALLDALRAKLEKLKSERK